MAAITKTIFSSAQKNALAAAKATRQVATEETKRQVETVKSQLSGSFKELNLDEEGPVPGVVQTVRESGPSIDRGAIAAREKAAYQTLEAQLQSLRAKREQASAEYLKTQTEKMQAPAEASPEPVAPQGRLNRAIGAVKNKVQSMISNRKQSETKQGSGKG